MSLGKKRPTYDADFKRNAINLCKEKGQTIPLVAKALGLHPATINYPFDYDCDYDSDHQFVIWILTNINFSASPRLRARKKGATSWTQMAESGNRQTSCRALYEFSGIRYYIYCVVVLEADFP